MATASLLVVEASDGTRMGALFESESGVSEWQTLEFYCTYIEYMRYTWSIVT